MTDSTDLYEEHPEVFLPMFDQWEERADDQVDGMLALLEDAYDLAPTTVLDVGCGNGRHVIAFAEREITAHGLDISDVYVERAMDRAASMGLSETTDFFVRDMRNIDGLAGTYDLVTCVYTSFGYFHDDTNAALLESFADRIEPGGALVVEVPNKEGFLASWGGGVTELGEDTVHAERHEYDPYTSRGTATIFAIEDGTYLGDGQFEVRFYAPVELRRLFEEAGFTDVHMYAGFDGGDLSRDSERLLVMGRA